MYFIDEVDFVTPFNGAVAQGLVYIANVIDAPVRGSVNFDKVKGFPLYDL